MEPHLEKMLAELKEGKAQLFDVREIEEWEMGHLKNAQLVPLSTLMSGKLPEEFNKNIHTYLHCRSGNRVHAAAPILQDMGFKNIIPLNEGFAELVEEGMEHE